jgi:hypothetical protein
MEPNSFDNEEPKPRMPLGSNLGNQQPMTSINDQPTEYADEDSEPSTGGQVPQPQFVQPVVTEPVQNLNNQPIQPPSEQSVDPASPVPPVANLAPAKKTHKTMLIVLASVLVLALASGYAIYALINKSSANKPAATTQTDSKTPAVANATTDTPTSTAVQAATGTLTDGSNAEATTTNTDDSNMATDANNSASTVGDSVDETKL